MKILKSLMEIVRALAFVFVAFFVVLYIAMLEENHETSISAEEIIISRVGFHPFHVTELVINLETKEEIIYIHNDFGQDWYISYDGGCECVVSANKDDAYRVSRYTYGQVTYRTGRTVERVGPYEDYAHLFNEAYAVRKSVKERFANILSANGLE